MKYKKINYLVKSLLLILVLTANLNCERDISDDARVATFAKTAEIFTDDFVGMGTNFYFPYGGSKPTAWSVDRSEGYNSTASMRFDVPNANDPEGNYAGAIFRIDGAGRDLTDYDALTFYVKASQGVNISEFGFGEDFDKNKYKATITNISVGTNWRKVIIPIPDASKLLKENGMFRYSAGTQGTNSLGYIFWIDDLKFEKLGTIAQPLPKILNGQNNTQQAFIGSTISITGLTQTFNLPTGLNQTIDCAPRYFQFSSSNTSIATVDDLGVVEVVGNSPIDPVTGQPIKAIITANIAGVLAVGSLTIESLGPFVSAPTPTYPSSNVISIFSDTYANVGVDFFNGFYGGQTTQTSDILIGTNNLKFYTNLNYVGIEFNNPPINGTTMQFLHLDILSSASTTTPFVIKIRDRGANGVLNTNVNTGAPILDDKEISYTVPANQIIPNQWLSINIPLTGNIANQKNNLAQIVFVGNLDFLLDNLYFYKL